MVFQMNSPLYAVEMQRKEGENLLYINYLGAPHVPSIGDTPEVMARTIGSLIENPNVSRVIFVQQRNYSYNAQNTFMLQEIANLYTFLTKQEKFLTDT